MNQMIFGCRAYISPRAILALHSLLLAALEASRTKETRDIPQKLLLSSLTTSFLVLFFFLLRPQFRQNLGTCWPLSQALRGSGGFAFSQAGVFCSICNHHRIGSEELEPWRPFKQDGGFCENSWADMGRWRTVQGISRRAPRRRPTLEGIRCHGLSLSTCPAVSCLFFSISPQPSGCVLRVY